MTITFKEVANLVALLESTAMHLDVINQQAGAHPMMPLLVSQQHESVKLAKKIRDNGGFPTESEMLANRVGLRPLNPGESPRQG